MLSPVAIRNGVCPHSGCSSALATLDTFTVADFQNIFEEWKKRWDWCIRVGGDYFEGGSQDV